MNEQIYTIPGSESMHVKMITRYLTLILAVPALHLLVYFIFPGNRILAFMLSLIAVIILVPGGEKPAGPNEVDNVVELQDVLDEDQKYHSMLGNIFNAMAQGASKDMYSGEVTGTGSYQQAIESGKARTREEQAANQEEIDISIEMEA